MILDWFFSEKMYFLWLVASCLDVKDIHSQDVVIGFERGKRRVLVADSGCPGLGGIGATR